MKILVKEKEYKRILSGEQTEVYKEVKPYYSNRFKCFQRSIRNEQVIDFQTSYCKGAPYVAATCSLKVGYGKEEWGAEPGVEYYILSIKTIICQMDTVTDFLKKCERVFSGKIEQEKKRVCRLKEEYIEKEASHGQIPGYPDAIIPDERGWERYAAAQAELKSLLEQLDLARYALGLIERQN